MKQGNSSLGSTSQIESSDRSRSNNAQSHLKLPKNKIIRQSIQDYDNEERLLDSYSSNQIERYNPRQNNTYNEYDGEYLKMKEEMDSWMPKDTAALYKILEAQYKKENKKVWGRDIFNNPYLSFEPNMNMALPANYRIGPGDAIFIDIYGASQKKHRDYSSS